MLWTHYLYLRNYIKTALRREEGVETIEWIGMAAVVLALVGALGTVLGKGGGEQVGQAIADTLTNWINQLGSGGGG